MQNTAIGEDHRWQGRFMIRQDVVGQRNFLGRRLDDPVRIVIADQETLNLCGLGIIGQTHQHNATRLFGDDAYAPPDGR
jgi:hypothetical protein